MDVTCYIENCPFNSKNESRLCRRDLVVIGPEGVCRIAQKPMLYKDDKAVNIVIQEGTEIKREEATVTVSD